MTKAEVVEKLYDMLWFANEYSEECSDSIGSGTLNSEGGYMFLKVERKTYRVEVTEVE